MFERFVCTPRLAITAPEKRCGKTTLLDVLTPLVPRALPASNITAPSLYRTVELAKPVLLIDEADTFLPENEELRGILNSGHKRGAQVIRSVGEDHEPRIFATHSPCAIALIGKLPSTLTDRSIPIRLRRRLPTEHIQPFRSDRTAGLEIFARKAARLAADNGEHIGSLDPELAPSIFNRDADNWRPLSAIATVAGGDWPERTRRVALALTGNAEKSSKAELLADIWDAFASKNCDRISSDDLVTFLIGIEDRPWSESNHGKPMTKNQLARRLKPFGLTPKAIRTAAGTPKGYALDDFTETCARYLPPPFQTATSGTSNDFNWLQRNQTATDTRHVAVSERRNYNEHNAVADVAVQNPENGQYAHVEASGRGDAEDADAKIPTQSAPENRASKNWQGRT